MVSCDNYDLGCNGGMLYNAWSYLEYSGIVADTCLPYTSGDGNAPYCSKKCTNNEQFTKYKCQKNSIVEATTINQIKSSIYNNGPMETSFEVYSDFMNYKSGIY